jgi:chemotaxis protein methyltransferase CheR
MHESEIKSIEIDLLLEALFKRYGYDFREYTRSMLERRIDNFQNDSAIFSMPELLSRVLREPTLFYNLISYFSINVTSLFRDPFFYAAFRKQVAPMLRTWPHIKLWDAGCATGEEVYSLAILLHEEGMFNRTTIYATDINASALETAKMGIYPLKIIQHGSLNYIESGARASFSDYYHAQYNAAKMDSNFSNNITFAKHNLTIDESFGEMQAIVCRNVLIYFNTSLQNRILKLFWESLEYGGFLCLGDKETIAHTEIEDKFETVDSYAKIYKKKFPNTMKK